MTGRIPTVCVVLVLLGTVPATAQTRQLQGLKGVAEVYVIIEALNNADATCGVTRAGLNTAVNKALLDNGVRITDRDVIDSEEAAYFRHHGWVDSKEKGPLAIPRLYVRVGTLYLEDNRQCVSSNSVQLDIFMFVTPWYNGQRALGTIELASVSNVVASRPSNHGQRIRDNVFEAAEQIAVAIRVANQ